MNQGTSGKPTVIVFVAVIFILGGMAGQYLWKRRVPAVAGTIYYPGGAFPFGPNKKATNLGPFYIDETEVSNAEFARYCRTQKVSDDACQAAEHAPPDLPVVNVSVEQARAFARSVGKRLPTALEWERAARGVDAMLYPWGPAEDASYANVSDNPTLKEHVLLRPEVLDHVDHDAHPGNVVGPRFPLTADKREIGWPDAKDDSTARGQ